MTKRVIEREQSIMGTIFFKFKVNTVEKVNNTHVHVLYILHFALRIPLKPVKEPLRCHMDGRIYKSVE